uniref:sodium/hydrogen exchanger 1-like n=1 Tax=Myxine glutinosa TaxID=7769 RepID=UPI00358FF6D1
MFARCLCIVALALVMSMPQASAVHHVTTYPTGQTDEQIPKAVEDVDIDEHGVRHNVSLFSVDFSHVRVPLEITIWLLFASLAKIGFHQAPRISSLVPESCLLIILGLALGWLLVLINNDKTSSSKPILSADVFFLYLLPPIVLDAGYFLPARSFLDNLGSICSFAVIGTLWNSFGIGLSIYALCRIPAFGLTGLPVGEALLFGSVISAVDPVAVLAVFQEVGVNEQLEVLVAGESLLNDAVTVVLYQLLSVLADLPSVPASSVLLGVVRFFVVCLGGIAFGICAGLLASFTTRFTYPVPALEPILILLTCYLAYLITEMLHLSGIMALISAALTMRSYVDLNLEWRSRTTLRRTLRALSSTSETLIFLLLGMATLDGPHDWSWPFVISTLILCLVWRATGVLILSWVANRVRLVPISYKDQFIIAYGGLRGAIAFSLVYLIPKVFHHRALFTTATITTLLFTVFVQGMTIRPLVDLLEVKKKCETEPTVTEEINTRIFDHLLGGIEDICGHLGHHHWLAVFERLNDRWLRRFLLRCPSAKHPTILAAYSNLEKTQALSLLSLHRISTTTTNLVQLEITQGEERDKQVVDGSEREGGSRTEEGIGGEVSLPVADMEDIRKLVERHFYRTRQRLATVNRHSLPVEDSERQAKEIMLRRRKFQRLTSRMEHEKRVMCRQKTMPENSVEERRHVRLDRSYTVGGYNSPGNKLEGLNEDDNLEEDNNSDDVFEFDSIEESSAAITVASPREGEGEGDVQVPFLKKEC